MKTDLIIKRNFSIEQMMPLRVCCQLLKFLRGTFLTMNFSVFCKWQLGTQKTKAWGQHKGYGSWLPLVPCSLLTRQTAGPLEMSASKPVPSWSLCLLTLPEGRFQIETRVHHKCINMSKRDCLKLCFITLELAAVIRNEWWVWVSGLRMAKFSLSYIIFGLDHLLLCF